MHAKRAVLFLGALMAFLAGCPKGVCASRAPASRQLTWITIPPDDVQVTPLGRRIVFGVQLPPQASPARCIEVRFPRPLEAARVEVLGTGPNHASTRLHQTRVRGNTLVLEIPPLTLIRLDLVVHHHLRPAPLPPSVRVGAQLRP